MKIIAFGTFKGGTGKTTVAFNVGGVLAEKYKVLFIDVDPQCNLSGACGIRFSKKARLSSRDIFMESNEHSPEELITKAPIPELPNLDIIPSHMLLTAVEFFMVSRSAREWVLYNYFEEHKEFFEKYDYIILDTNPGMGIINQNAFTAAESIVLVTDVGEDGIAGVELFCFLWKQIRKALRLQDNIKALIINLADRRINLTGELKEYCEDNEDILPLLIDDMIYMKVAYKEARITHKPVNVLKGVDEAVNDVRAVIDGLFEKGVL